MKLTLLYVISLAVWVHRVELSLTCITPDGLRGRCLHLNACKRLQNISNHLNTFVTLYDYMLLTQSKCKTTMRNLYCCPYYKTTLVPTMPVACYTPYEQHGTCTRLDSCPALNMKLKEPVNNNNLNYIESLSCPVYDQYSVCCPTTPFLDIDPRTSKAKTDDVIPTTGPTTRRSIEPYEVATPTLSKRKCSLTSLPPDPRSDCCGYQSADDDRIIGGAATSIDQYPWLVLIEYKSIFTQSLEPLCGGSLISGKYVLTASHCVAGRVLTQQTPVNVILGEYDIRNPGPDCMDTPGGGEDCTDGPLTIAIEETIPHESYSGEDKSRNHDIALLRLSETAPYTDFIRPICLPTTDLTLNPPAEFRMYTSGWGFIENTHGIRSNVKLDVELPYKPRSMCKQLYSSINVSISERQICAGGEMGKDACSGDSGGPLMYKIDRRFYAIGVVSFGPKPCGQANAPSVYTNVYQYLPWIHSKMRT